MTSSISVAFALSFLALVAGGCANSGNTATLPSLTGDGPTLLDAAKNRVRIRQFADLPQYPPYYGPTAIAAGPDKLLWVVDGIDPDFGADVVVGIATSGKARHTYNGPGTGYEIGFEDITAGPDGALWMTAGNNYQVEILRMSPKGVYTEFLLTNGTNPLDIATGPDKALWFTADYFKGGSLIERITTKGHLTTYPLSVASVLDITAGPDGALWFTQPEAHGVGRITTRGKITEYSNGITGNPYSIATGADGALWFTEQAPSGGGGWIGRITTSGSVTEYTKGITPMEEPIGIAAGPDGAMWFTETQFPYAGAKIGRISMQGTIHEYSRGLNPQAGPSDITAGQDGRMWFVETNADETGRLAL